MSQKSGSKALLFIYFHSFYRGSQQNYQSRQRGGTRFSDGFAGISCSWQPQSSVVCIHHKWHQIHDFQFSQWNRCDGIWWWLGRRNLKTVWKGSFPHFLTPVASPLSPTGHSHFLSFSHPHFPPNQVLNWACRTNRGNGKENDSSCFLLQLHWCFKRGPHDEGGSETGCVSDSSWAQGGILKATTTLETPGTS